MGRCARGCTGLFGFLFQDLAAAFPALPEFGVGMDRLVGAGGYGWEFVCLAGGGSVGDLLRFALDSRGGCPHMSRFGGVCFYAVFGDLPYYVACVGVELGASRVLHCDVEGAEDQFGALYVDGVAHEGVDDFHQGGLDGFFVLENRDGMKTGLRRLAYAAVGVLVEVAELLSVESRGAATDSGDFDMSASFGWHFDLVYLLD